MTAEDSRGRVATRAVVLVTAVLLGLSLRQVWVRARPPLPYPGMRGLSATWNEPPADDTTAWAVSEGQVPAPPANASRTELLAWLSRHYPVLSLDVSREAQGADPRLDLGGGPPRRLFVERGRGIVGREP